MLVQVLEDFFARVIRREQHSLFSQRQLAVFNVSVAAGSEIVHHPLPPLTKRACMCRIGCKAVQLLRIAVQIEKLLLAVGRVKDVVADVAVRKRVPMHLRAEADVVLCLEEFPPARFIPANQIQHAAAVKVGSNRRRGCIEQHGKHIFEGNRLGEDLPALTRPCGHRTSIGIRRSC